jgi:hypothetical protein
LHPTARALNQTDSRPLVTTEFVLYYLLSIGIVDGDNVYCNHDDRQSRKRRIHDRIRIKG